jgi:capsular polysaccharide transport system permease protein
MLRETTRPDDPRLTQAQRRVDVIQQRIAAERSKMDIGAENGTEALASLVGEFERLSVDREFAEETYISALATYDNSLAEARRKSRYLAAYAAPTEAESSRYPRRLELMGLVSVFLFLFWSISVLVGYSLRDRR